MIGVDEKLAELRTLLSGRASVESWLGICALIDTAASSVQRALLIDYADAHLSGWEHGLRKVCWPDELSELARGHFPHSWVLAKTCVLEEEQVLLLRRDPNRGEFREALSGIESLVLSGWGGAFLLDSGALKEIFVGLREVDISGRVLSPMDIEEISRSGILKGVRSLKLNRCRLSDLAIGALASGESGLELTELWLADNDLNTEGMLTLLDSDVFVGLERLEVKANAIDDRFLVKLASSPRLKDLHSLGIGANSMTSGGLEVLLRSPHLGKLERLDVGFLSFGEGTLELLLSKVSGGQLRELGLSGVGLTDEGLTKVASHPSVSGLERLYLAKNHLTDESIEALAESPVLEGVKELDLKKNEIGDRGVCVLAESPVFRSLQRLNLSYNRFRARGVMAISRSEILRGVQHLDVRGVKI